MHSVRHPAILYANAGSGSFLATKAQVRNPQILHATLGSFLVIVHASAGFKV